LNYGRKISEYEETKKKYKKYIHYSICFPEVKCKRFYGFQLAIVHIPTTNENEWRVYKKEAFGNKISNFKN